MTDRKRPPLESLHHALKGWDPVRREGSPAADAVDRWRRRMLAAEAEGRRRAAPRWRPALAGVAAVLTLVALHDGARRPTGSRPAGEERAVGAGGGERGAGPAGTADGVSTLQVSAASPPDSLRGPLASDGRGGRAAESASSVRRRAAAPSERHRPSAVERPAGGRPEAAATGQEASGAPSLLSTTPDGAARRPRPGTAAESTLAAAPPAGDAAPAAPGEAATISAPPLAPHLPPPLPPPDSRRAAAAPAPAEAPAFREVQIIAPGGTRIVWLVAADSAPTDPSSREDT